MKKYLCYFASMLLVLTITDYCLSGRLLRYKYQASEGITAQEEMSSPASLLYSTRKETEELSSEELGILIAQKSCDFVQAAFKRDKAKIAVMLHGGTEYAVKKDNSSYVRYKEEDLHVEAYMATNKKLIEVEQNWYVIEDDGTITSGVQVAIEGEPAPQTWYIHYRKEPDDWRIYMVENGI